MNYRADIDGLRAIAVLMVVFYHAGFNSIPGGFIGVDIFFVISGYLITNIVFREIQANTFTFANFYSRRIKRILPAFYLVGLTTFLAGYFLLLPSSYVNFSKSLLSASLFVSNIFFWRETGGYFGEDSQEMPLLHTWTLSVEEQFYLFWPVILLTMYKWLPKQTLVPFIIVAIALTFAGAEWGATHFPSLTYYMLPTRAGELLLGALLVLTPSLGVSWNKNTLNFVSVMGLALTIVPGFILSKHSTFPGLNALWPCLGAVLVIFSGRDKDVIGAKVLSTRPAVFIGLISYSLYLWHWPLVALTGYLQYELNTNTGILIVLASIGLAYLSWKLVEQPFRRRKMSFKAIFIRLFIMPCAITTLLCLYVISTKSNFNYSALLSPYLETRSHVARNMCHVNEAELPNLEGCKMGKVGGDRKALLWGDSHANSLAGFFNAIGANTNEEVIDITFGDCPPLLEAKINSSKINGACAERNRNVAGLIRKDRSIGKVYVVGAFDGYLSASYSYPIDKIKEGLLNSINLIRSNGKQAILVIDVPRFNLSLSLAGLKNNIFLSKQKSYEKNDSLTQEMRSVLGMFGEIAAVFPDVRFVDVRSLLCDQGQCSPYVDGLPMYEDGNHLNWKGSGYLGNLFLKRGGGEFITNSWPELKIKYLGRN